MIPAIRAGLHNGDHHLAFLMMDWLTRHVQILELNSESLRLIRSHENVASQAPCKPEDASRSVNAALSYSYNV